MSPSRPFVVLLALTALACEPPPAEHAVKVEGLAKDSDGNTVYPDAGGFQPGCTGGSPTYLMEAAAFAFEDHGNHPLTTPNFTLFVCTEHFPIGSAARAEVEKAIQLYNNVSGTTAYISLGTATHKGIGALFPTDPTKSFFDFVDNSTVGFPCHGAGDTTGWSMNTCRHEKNKDWGSTSNPVDQFVISVNAAAYSFDTDLTSDDYPKFENIAHELGHAFGMNHTSDWLVDSSHELLSTMQGNLAVLAPHDRAYLRHFYPGTSGDSLNLAASPKIRVFDSASTAGYSNLSFAASNPKQLYLSGGTYYDCATGQLPKFQAQWLNQGQAATNCTIKNRFRLGPAGAESSTSKVTLSSWEARLMPAASQDRIVLTLTLTDSKLASLAKEQALDLSFMVDHDLAYAEATEEDNVVTSTVTLHANQASCSP